MPNVTAFYERLCYPTKSESNKTLATKYVELEFGKRAMMRHIFNSTEGNTFGAAIQDEEDALDALLNGRPPPGSSARAAEPRRSWMSAWGDDTAPLIMVGAALAVTIALLGIMFAYLMSQVAND